MAARGNVVIQVPSELFALAESSHFEGAWPVDVIDAGPDSYRFDEPVTWSIDLTNTGDALLATGAARGVATTSCARCLDPVTIELDGDIEGYFVIGDAEAPDDMDDDEFDRLPEDGMIDAVPLIEAALLMDMPLLPLCSEDCAGLCSTCGANLNDGPCGCSADDVDPLHPFAALRGLKFE